MTLHEKNEELMSDLMEWLNKPTELSKITIAPLSSDVSFALKRWKEEERERQFWGRTLVRCLCAHVEAVLFSLRCLTLSQTHISIVPLLPQEVNLLTDVTRPRGIRQNVQETFRLFGKVNGATVSIDYAAAGFGDLHSVFEKRNMLMHPKGPFDVEVRDKVVDTVGRASIWFEGALTSGLEQVSKHLHDEAEGLRAAQKRKT